MDEITVKIQARIGIMTLESEAVVSLERPHEAGALAAAVTRDLVGRIAHKEFDPHPIIGVEHDRDVRLAPDRKSALPGLWTQPMPPELQQALKLAAAFRDHVVEHHIEHGTFGGVRVVD